MVGCLGWLLGLGVLCARRDELSAGLEVAVFFLPEDVAEIDQAGRGQLTERMEVDQVEFTCYDTHLDYHSRKQTAQSTFAPLNARIPFVTTPPRKQQSRQASA